MPKRLTTEEFINRAVDGQQHFEPIRFNGMSMVKAISVFYRTKKYDELKNNYCKKNNIPLLRIPYKKFKDIPEILYKEVLNREIHV